MVNCRPWIKVYGEKLLRDRQHVRMSLEARGLYYTLYALCSRDGQGGWLALDEETLKWHLRDANGWVMDLEPVLAELRGLGLIERKPGHIQVALWDEEQPRTISRERVSRHRSKKRKVVPIRAAVTTT